MQNDFDEDNNELQWSDEQVQQLIGFDQREKQRLKKIIVRILIVLLVLVVGCWWMIGYMMHYTTHSRRMGLNARAQNVYNIALLWEEEQNPKLSTHISQLYQYGEFGEYQKKNISESNKSWYAIVYDSDGDLLYTLFSYKQIPEQYLTSPPTAEETTKLLNSYFDFRRKKAVGVWYADNEKND